MMIGEEIRSGLSVLHEGRNLCIGNRKQLHVLAVAKKQSLVNQG